MLLPADSFTAFLIRAPPLPPFAGLRKDPKSAAQVILLVDATLLTSARVFHIVRLLLTATLATETNGKMMGILRFGNVGRGNGASQEASEAHGNVTVNVVPTLGVLVTAMRPRWA